MGAVVHGEGHPLVLDVGAVGEEVGGHHQGLPYRRPPLFCLVHHVHPIVLEALDPAEPYEQEPWVDVTEHASQEGDGTAG